MMDKTNQPAPQGHPTYTQVTIEVANGTATRKDANVVFYARAIEKGLVTSQNDTRRAAKCDCCDMTQDPGMRSFFMAGPGGHKFHVCEVCWKLIVDAVDVNALTWEQR